MVDKCSFWFHLIKVALIVLHTGVASLASLILLLVIVFLRPHRYLGNALDIFLVIVLIGKLFA